MASNSKTYTRICVDCGKVMQQVYQTKMRCPECAAQRKTAAARPVAGSAQGGDPVSHAPAFQCCQPSAPGRGPGYRFPD